MGDFEFGTGVKVAPIQSTQSRIAEWVLDLAILSTSFDKWGALSGEDYEEFLDRVMTLALILEPYIVKQFPKDGPPLLQAIYIYRISVDVYVREGFPHKVVVTWRLGQASEPVVKEYPTYEAYKDDAIDMKKRGYRVVSLRILPSDELLRELARLIVVTARDIGLLAFNVQHKPAAILSRRRRDKDEIMKQIAELATAILRGEDPNAAAVRILELVGGGGE